MRRITAALTAVAAGLVSSLTTTAPAYAANEVTISMTGGVLYDDCGYYGFSYAAAIPAGYGPYWNMDLQLLGPDGNEAASAYVYGEASGGSDDFFLCESPNLAGTYSIRGTGEACDADYDCLPITAAPGTVTFRLPKTRTSLIAKPRRAAKGQVVRFIITSTDERPTGYFGTSYATVKLQAKRNGSWRNIDKAMTSDRGRVVVRTRYTGGRVAVRAVTLGDSDRTGSTSRILKFH